METYWQLVRFSVVGLSSNAFLYIIYLVSTSLGLGHKTAMTLIYAFGIMITFLFNRRWTFDHRGHVPGTLSRYVSAYGGMYLFNLAALYILVDELGIPHQLVQGILIFIIAAIIFLLQKYWVFTNSRESQEDYP